MDTAYNRMLHEQSQVRGQDSDLAAALKALTLQASHKPEGKKRERDDKVKDVTRMKTVRTHLSRVANETGLPLFALP